MSYIRKLLAGYQNYRRFCELNRRKLPIAFFAELGSDRLYFEGMIRHLVEEAGQPILYLTSSPADPMLQYRHTDFHPVCIGEGIFRNLAFREINTQLFVMTMSDLETYDLKRSIHPVHYVYIFHSLVSTHMTYRHQALNAYDTIFCVGPHHEAEIREAEQLFNLRPKSFVQHGYPRIDQIIADYATYQQATSQPSKAPQILIAPSWGPNSISNLCLQPLIRILLEAGYDVTFRPHPMTTRDEPQRIQVLQKEFSGNACFNLDMDISQADSLFRSDVMISDWSGVALEFALATEKPVVFIDVPRKINNKHFDKFTSIPVEVAWRERLGPVIFPEALEQLPALLSEVVSTLDARKQAIAELREQIVYNIGRSSEVGAREILALLQQKMINNPKIADTELEMASLIK